MLRATHLRWVGFLALVALAGPAGALELRPGDLVVIDTNAKALVRLDPATGKREEIMNWWNDTGKHLAYPWGIAIDPLGMIVLSDMNARAIFRIDPVTGRKTIVSGGPKGRGPLLTSLRGIALDGDGGAYTVGTLRRGRAVIHMMFHVDLTSGDRRTVSAMDLGKGPKLAHPSALVLEPGGTLLVNMRSSGSVTRIDPKSGDRTVVSSPDVGSGPPLHSPLGMVLLKDGDIAITERTQAQVVRVDTKTGDRTVITSKKVGSGAKMKGPFGVVQAPDGDLYVSDVGTWSVYRVNITDGTRTVIASKEVGSGPALQVPRHLLLIPGGADKTGSVVLPALVLVGLLAIGGLLVVTKRRAGGRSKSGSDSA